MVVLFWTKWVQLPHKQRARWKNVTGSPPTCHLHHEHGTLFNIQFFRTHRHIHPPWQTLSTWGGKGGEGGGEWGGTPSCPSRHLSNLGCWDECLNLMKICHVTRLTWTASLELGSWDKCLNRMKSQERKKERKKERKNERTNVSKKVRIHKGSWNP
jgi:hypothetical protein